MHLFLKAQKHSFHIINRSQLPFLAGIYAMLFTMSAVYYLQNFSSDIAIRWNHFVFHMATIGLVYIMISWFIMIVFESGKGYHTLAVQRGLKYGFWLFLISEAMLFFSFFWSFFHYKLNPSVTIGICWPPKSVQIIDPYQIPLINTIILLSSGFTATIAHRAILKIDYIWNSFRQNQFLIYLLSTIILGYIFLGCQVIEYRYGINQNWASNVYWSIFFLLTGFHGAHVVIGTLFLQFNFVRAFICRMLNIPESILETRGSYFLDLSRWNLGTSQHLGLETALYYWHFVDAVWILLYLIVYVGS